LAVTLAGIGAGAELPLCLIMVTEILDLKDKWIAIILNVFCPIMSSVITSIYLTCSI